MTNATRPLDGRARVCPASDESGLEEEFLRHASRWFLSNASAVCLLMAGALYAQTTPRTPTPVAVKFDEFNYDRETNARARLAPFARALHEQPRARAFIIAYGDRLFRYGDVSARNMGAMLRTDLIYLSGVAIAWERVITIDGGYREENMIELYLVPPDAPAPTPRPTLQRDQVTFCPSVTVNAPLYVWDTKRPLRFSISVREEMTKTVPTYRWVVSPGSIEGGQGTSEIVVRQPQGEYQPATATVEVGGYARECEAGGSATSPKTLISVPLKLDEFGDLPSGDMKARLDHYAYSLQASPEMQGHIVYYGNRRYGRKIGRRGETARQVARLKTYLVNSRGIPADRLQMIDGGLREEWTAELWLSPRDATSPTPTPTVSPGEVRARPGRTMKRARP